MMTTDDAITCFLEPSLFLTKWRKKEEDDEWYGTHPAEISVAAAHLARRVIDLWQVCDQPSIVVAWRFILNGALPFYSYLNIGMS